MTDIKPASEVRDEIKESIEESLENDKRSINDAIESAKSGDTWPASHPVSGRDEEYQGKLLSDVKGSGYSAYIENDTIYIKKPG